MRTAYYEDGLKWSVHKNIYIDVFYLFIYSASFPNIITESKKLGHHNSLTPITVGPYYVFDDEIHDDIHKN